MQPTVHMYHEANDTIVAIVTPSGQGAIGVLRLSGPQAITIAAQHCSQPLKLSQSASHRMIYAHFIDEHRAEIDDCLFAVFRAPHSYTGEDVVEISCHGSPYILSEIIRILLLSGARLAEPGEFTKRAFLHGRMDLSQAEAVADLIASRTSSQHRLARRQMKGHISDALQDLRTRLIKFTSLIELENDFGEEDVTFADSSELQQVVREVLNKIARLQASFATGQAIKEGITVAIVGKPNVGKSTLLNRLLSEERAIVSDIPGTTRDFIEDELIIGGQLFRLVDTAGLRDTDDAIESMGIARSYAMMERADIILWMVDVREELTPTSNEIKLLSLKEDQRLIVLFNKIDLVDQAILDEKLDALHAALPQIHQCGISSSTGLHIDRLINQLIEMVDLGEIQTDSVILSNMRHKAALEQTTEALNRVMDGLKLDLSSDLIALDLRHALHHLGLVAGSISTDDLLDSIFRDFCIGK